MKFFKIFSFIASLLFLGYILSGNYSEIKNSLLFTRKNIVLETALLAVAYALSLFFVALGWKSILSLLTKKKLSFSFVWVWLQSNVYKYLPGNVFNYVSRQIISKKMGVEHKILIESNIVEALLLASSSLVLSGSILYFIYDLSVNEYFSFLNKNYIYVGLILVGLLLWYLNKFKKIQIIDSKIVILCYLIFFLTLGASAYIILNYQMKIEFSFLLITAIYSFAWLVGFITPGAPGGIGVRESVFVILSNGLLTESDAVVLSMMLRFVSIVGEVILFVIASMILNRENNK